MSDDSVSTDPAFPAAALGVYAESLLRGRRVGILGDSTLPLAEQILARGARLVHVYDPDAGRLAVGAAKRSADAGSRGSRPAVGLFTDDLGVRDGAFDVVLIPDLSLFDDAQEIVRRVRRLVAPSGVVVIASPNPDATRFLLPPSGSAERAPGYYELFDVVSLQFPEVKMLGQAPFVGYTIVDFAESEPDVSVDTSLLPQPETPEWYIVVASDRRVDLDAYSLVELPAGDVARAVAPEPTFSEPTTLPKDQLQGRAAATPSDSEVALTEARTRISVLVTENETLREQIRERARAERLADQMGLRAAELERDLDAEKRRADDLRREVSQSRSKADELDGSLQRLEAELEEERREVRLTRERLEEQRRAVEEQRRAAEEQRRAAEEQRRASEEQARALQDERRHREASVAQAQQVRSLDQTLAAAQRRISELESQLAALEAPTLRSKEIQQQQQQRIAALEAQRAELNDREQRMTGKTRDLEQTIGKLRTELADAVSRADAAEVETGRVRETVAAEREQLAEDRQKIGPLEQEIRRLERALRDRGHEVVRLQRDMAETERVGREILFELEAFLPGGRGAPGGKGPGGTGKEPTPSAPSQTAPSQAQIDLAERAARAEADLLAAGWTIAKLEREVARHEATLKTGTSPATRELEMALAAAQREIALLRRGDSSALGSGAASAAAAIEDALLLNQIERERATVERAP